MSPKRFSRPNELESELPRESASAPPSGIVRSSGLHRKAAALPPLDPLEEALLSRPARSSREPEPAVHEILYRFAVGDEVGALAAAKLLLDGRSVPALTVSMDVLDELAFDRAATAVLARVDGTTPLSWVLGNTGLDYRVALRTTCELVERRVIILRPPKLASQARR